MTSIVLGPLSSSLLLSTSVQLIRFLLQTNRVARCPLFNRTVRHFSSLSGIILIVIPDNTCVNSSIVCDKDTGTASVRYFGESHLASLQTNNQSDSRGNRYNGLHFPPIRALI